MRLLSPAFATLQFRENPQSAPHHPAVAAGLPDHLWNYEEIAALAE
jgi:hypothetical protein